MRIAQPFSFPYDIVSGAGFEGSIKRLDDVDDLWDGLTYYTNPVTHEVLPSSSDSVYKPVYGDGSLFCLQLNLKQLVELFWRVKELDVSLSPPDSSSPDTYLGSFTGSALTLVAGDDPHKSTASSFSPPTLNPTDSRTFTSIIATELGLLKAFGNAFATDDAPLYSASAIAQVEGGTAYGTGGIIVTLPPITVASAGYAVTYNSLPLSTSIYTIVRVGDKFWLDPGSVHWSYNMTASGISDDFSTSDTSTYQAASTVFSGDDPTPDDYKPIPFSLTLFGTAITGNRFCPFFEHKDPESLSSDNSSLSPDTHLANPPTIYLTPLEWRAYNSTWDTTTGLHA